MSDPQLVLMPGMDGTGRLFAPLAAALGARREPVVVTYPFDGPQDYDTLLDVALAALPSGAFTLVAESFSGPLAVRLAAGRPAGLQALVLAASFVRCPLPLPLRWLAPLAHPAVFALAPRRGSVHGLLGGEGTDELRTAVGEVTASVPPAVFAERARAILSVDVRDALSACAVPVLYLRATRDRLVGPRNASDVQRALPSARVVDIAAPHLVLQTAPLACVAAIDALLASS